MDSQDPKEFVRMKRLIALGLEPKNALQSTDYLMPSPNNSIVQTTPENPTMFSLTFNMNNLRPNEIAMLKKMISAEALPYPNLPRFSIPDVKDGQPERIETTSGPSGLTVPSIEVLQHSYTSGNATTSCDTEYNPFTTTTTAAGPSRSSTVTVSDVMSGGEDSSSDSTLEPKTRDLPYGPLTVSSWDFVKPPKTKIKESVQDNDEIICAVCMVNVPDGVVSSCMHAYCMPCLHDLKRLRKPCPKCKKSFRAYGLIDY